jgi:hypothetical protein
MHAIATETVRYILHSRSHNSILTILINKVLHWKTHQKNCEPVVLAKSDGNIISQIFNAKVTENLEEYIYCEAVMKNGYVKHLPEKCKCMCID